MNSMYPNVLILSNNSFSAGGSNGRTLANFFLNWPLNCIAQFYIYNETPDSNVCMNYFRVTDREAMRAFLKRDSVGKRVTVNKSSHNDNQQYTASNKIKRTPFTCMIREIIWGSKRWKSIAFNQWIDDFKPDIVLLQAGDSAFMCRLATEIAQEKDIPLVIYNSENYYFKDQNYMLGSGIASFLYPIFIKYFRKQFDKTIDYASHSIYISDKLRKLYDDKFKRPSTVIMTSTDMVPAKNEKENAIPIISYLGNLGVGRYESLIEIAETLQDINSNYYLDVYGNIPDEDILTLLKGCKGINYRGVVKYTEVVKVMHKSDLLVHVENFSEFYKEDTKYGFSTKIADSLACGTCFFVYAPKELASTQYLLSNEVACVVTQHEDLRSTLKTIIENENLRKVYAEKAQQIAARNHNKQKNSESFIEILRKEVSRNESIAN